MKLATRVETDKWSIPPDLFKGETVLILGNGPTLSNYSWHQPRPTIAINDAWRMAPRADVLYFADENWFDANKDALDAFQGKQIVTRSVMCAHSLRVPVRMVDRSWGCALSKSPSHLAGFDSGSNAINLAYLAGARRILLLGFDMRAGHWHSNTYIDDCPDTHYADWFMPSHRAMAEALAHSDCEVINVTPGSALDCYPKQSPEDFGIMRHA